MSISGTRLAGRAACISTMPTRSTSQTLNPADAELPCRRDVVLPGARFQPSLVDPQVHVVHLAVALGRREADEILAVQLVGHLGKGGAQILPVVNVRVAAAGLLRDPREAGVW